MGSHGDPREVRGMLDFALKCKENIRVGQHDFFQNSAEQQHQQMREEKVNIPGGSFGPGELLWVKS